MTRMTPDEALKLKSFKHYCNCGGFAIGINGRDPHHPHMAWCAQFEEWEAWRRALNENRPERAAQQPGRR